MVFEQIFRVSWIEKKEHAFFLAFFYTLLGFTSAYLIFPASIGLMSVAFTSILLIPSLANLLRMEENIEIREKKLSLKLLFKDHKEIFKIYIFLFLGIFFAYAISALFLKNTSILNFFAPQMNSAGYYGSAISAGALYSIILNNLLIFIVCFILSLVYGAGSILFLTWNASVWGIVFTIFVKNIASQAGVDPFHQFTTNIIPFLPHMITEAVAYISAAIVGGVLSKAVIREKIGSDKFRHILTDACILFALGMLLVIIAGIIEVSLYF